MFWDPGSSRGTISRPEKKFLLGSKQKNVLHFAGAKILIKKTWPVGEQKQNNSPDLDRFTLTDSGVEIDGAFDLLPVSGD